MKKNFFKKLAFVLAFALIFTTVAPNAAVSAATKTPKMHTSSKVLVLAKSASYDFNVDNKVSGSKYAWSSSNTSVATVKSNGVVTGKKIGTAKITCKVTLPSKKSLKLTATVTVKENMKTITISNAPKDAIKVAEGYDLNRTYTTVSGAAKSTDITKWEITKGAENATIDANGLFTAKAAGEYTVVARAFQSAAQYDAYVAGDTTAFTAVSEPATIKVNASIVDVKLVTTKQIKVTFDSSVKDLVKAKSDVTISQKLTGDATAMVPVASLDSVSEDGKTITVSIYDSFTDKQTYVVSAANSTFELYAQIGTPVSISMDNQTIAAGTSTKVAYTLLDQYGVDVSAVYDAQVVKTSSVPFDAGKSGYLTLGDKAVSFVEYSYTIFNSADGSFKTITTGTKTITGAAATVGSTLEWNIGSATFATSTQTVVAGDTSKVIYGRVKKSDGTYTATTNYVFTSLNPSVLVVDANGNKLNPQAEGTALVKVTDLSGNLVAYINVKVLAKPATATVKASATQVSLSNSISGTPESATVNIVNVDQYGTETAAAISESYVLTQSKTTDIAAISVSGNAITFTAVSGKTGSFQYYVKTSEGKVVTVSVAVVAPGVLTGYVVSADNSSIDAYVANTDTASTVNFTVYGVDASQVKKELVKVGAVTGQTITYSVTKPDGTVVALTDGNADGTVSYAVDDTAATVATGNYTFTVSVNGIKYTKTFEVKNTRTVPTFSVKAISTEVATGSAVTAAAANLISVKAGDTDLVITGVTFVSSNSSIIANTDSSFSATAGTITLYVSKVTVNNGGVSQDVTINQGFTVVTK